MVLKKPVGYSECSIPIHMLVVSLGLFCTKHTGYQSCMNLLNDANITAAKSRRQGKWFDFKKTSETRCHVR